MPSPGSCSRCHTPLPAASDSGLCPVCLGTDRDRADSATSTPGGAALLTSLSQRRQQQAPAHDHPTLSGLARLPSFFASTDDGAPPRPEYSPTRVAPPGYELLHRLGGGGMGEVYLARVLAPTRLVAVKFLNSPASAKAVERFRLEVRAMAEVDHPNVAKVIAVETNGREPFFSMEYAPGGTLADLVRPGRTLPDPGDAARLILGAAEGVAAVHARGILHRDLKPSNILLATTALAAPASDPPPRPPADPDADTTDFAPPEQPPDLTTCTPKVADFGLAKRTDRDDGLTTRSGAMGTPCYMSPEAAVGRAGTIGKPADVYGLGATLYHLLTGRPPFGGDPQVPYPEVVRQVQSDLPARPRTLRPDLPADLEGIVVKAMDKDPGRRYPTASALAADLRQFLDGRRPAAPRLTPLRRARGWAARRSRRLVAGVCVVAAAVGLVFVGLMLAPVPVAPTPTSPVAAVAPVPRDQNTPPPKDPVADIRKKLAAGEAVELVPAKGLPAWHAWHLTPSVLDKSPLADGSCAFLSNDYTLLELLPDPGVDSYRVTAEIRQLRRVGGPDALPSGDFVGFYFAGQTRMVSNGRLVHTLAGMKFRDTPRAAAPDAQPLPTRVRLDRVAIVQFPDRLPISSEHGVASANFAPTPRWPGDWRRVAVEVAPDGVRMEWWDEPTKQFRVLKAWTRSEFVAWYADVGASAALVSPDIRLEPAPAWHPRMPLGIWCHQSSVAVRNVVVHPARPGPRS